METTRLSTKGQIVVPLKIRTSRAWGAGTEFTVEETPEGVLLRPVARFPACDLDTVAGCLKSGAKAKSLADISAVVRREVTRRHDSGRY